MSLLDDFSKLHPPPFEFPKQQKLLAPHLKTGEPLLQLFRTNAFWPYKIWHAWHDSEHIPILSMFGLFGLFVPLMWYVIPDKNDPIYRYIFYAFMGAGGCIFVAVFVYKLHPKNWPPTCYVALTQQHLYTLIRHQVQSYPLAQILNINLEDGSWVGGRQDLKITVVGQPGKSAEKQTLYFRAIPQATLFRMQLISLRDAALSKKS